MISAHGGVITLPVGTIAFDPVSIFIYSHLWFKGREVDQQAGRIGPLSANRICGTRFPEPAYNCAMLWNEPEYESRASWPRHYPASFCTLTVRTA